MTENLMLPCISPPRLFNPDFFEVKQLQDIVQLNHSHLIYKETSASKFFLLLLSLLNIFSWLLSQTSNTSHYWSSNGLPLFQYIWHYQSLYATDQISRTG